MYTLHQHGINHRPLRENVSTLQHALNLAYSEAKRNHSCVRVALWGAFSEVTVARFDYRQVSWFDNGKFYHKDLSAIK